MLAVFALNCKLALAGRHLLEALKRWRNEYDGQRQKAKYPEGIVQRDKVGGKANQRRPEQHAAIAWSPHWR
ncbi:hypothetical protein HORIV_12820 [Vreelandella olivaria]|uniref:Uncharacterized protein n=1 Tax=Vreelandella olivaria TaxID=390919 RepID=A0ABN5WPE8_9GAMM|nr:hypothetical protein HORIV_12820 [Halomonas olivaria]